jgi:hypothetical protein
VSSVYEFLKPYLIGFYLALHQFREARDPDGWPANAAERLHVLDGLAHLEERISEAQSGVERLSEDVMDSSLRGIVLDTVWGVNGETQDDGQNGPTTDGVPYDACPDVVPITGLLRRNAASILTLLQSDAPVQRLVRPALSSDLVGYGATDASGEGFGGREELLSRDALAPTPVSTFFYGYWGSDLRQDQAGCSSRPPRWTGDVVRYG